MTVLTGRCLCGRVTFAVAAPFRWVAHCHCESCRRATASPFTTFAGAPAGGFRWTGAAPAEHASSPGVTRYFCPTCGTPMGYRTERRPEDFDLYVATLDAREGVEPQVHVHWSEHVAWVRLADDLPRKG